LDGLTDRSRRPYRHANQLPTHIETLIVRCKQDMPRDQLLKEALSFEQIIRGDVRG
jgi:hypothetical protein